MPDPSIMERVTIPEQKGEALTSLPARAAALELQIVQLRDEMRSGFSAVRREMAAFKIDFRSELHTTAETLRVELQEGDEETRRYMRVLHEEVLARIATITESRQSRRRR